MEQLYGSFLHFVEWCTLKGTKRRLEQSVSLSSLSKYSLHTATLNRPLFAGERLVRMLGCFFIWVQSCIEHLLCFMRRDISDGAVQALGVVPIDPFQRFPFKLAH